MASSVLERTRTHLEEIEALEHAVADALENKSKAHKAAAATDLKVAAYMLQAQRAASDLAASWEDNDGSRRTQLQAMVGISASDDVHQAPDLLSAFYAKLDEVKAAHADSRGQAPQAPQAATATADDAAVSSLSSFTSEELYGRYVDLCGLFEEFGNLPSVREARFVASTDGRQAVGEDLEDVREQGCADYATYLQSMPELHATLPSRVKLGRAYRRYVPGLARYLLSFLQKRAPLVDLQEVLRDWAQDFDKQWQDGQVAGWARGGEAGSGAAEPAPGPAALVDLGQYDSSESLLEALGQDGCKAQLQARGLKAGGSPEERAARLWSVRGLSPEQYPKKIRAAPQANGQGATTAPTQKEDAPAEVGAGASAATRSAADVASTAGSSAPAVQAGPGLPLVDPSAWGTARFGGPPGSSTKTAAWCEFVAMNCARVLGDVLLDTRRRVQRRATRTYAELQTDREAEVAEVEGEAGAAVAQAALDDDDDDAAAAPLYNPLNIPLGWDGKPIPYWLYRLHGLNIEYGCEICGGAVYRGRRDFDRHFREWKHAAGMRALGIPNTKHFHDITKIADARSLYARIKGLVDSEQWKAEGPAGEEYEDSQGTVLDRKTYEDLARAGML